MQLIVLIRCYIINSNTITPLSERPERIVEELRPGSRPEICAVKRWPGEWPENESATNQSLTLIMLFCEYM